MHKEFLKVVKEFLKRHELIEFSQTGDIPCFECRSHNVMALLVFLYEHVQIQAHCLLDICVVDYLHYGLDEWVGAQSTATGFDRARRSLANKDVDVNKKDRFVVVYHLLSLSHNQRFRVKLILDDISHAVSSVTKIWPNANWYEREAFDLFGIRFSEHPGLRRLLTDYGFVGYPMRKDFPLIGQVEMRYDATLERCLYEPVQIQDRVSVPKVIRKDDDRYAMKGDE